MARLRYLVVLCAGLALLASVALTPSAGAHSGPIRCPNYHGRVLGANGPGTTSSVWYRKVTVTGVSCRLADKEFRMVVLPGDHPSIVVTVGGLSFNETVQYLPHGFDLYLNGSSPKDLADAITAVSQGRAT